MLGMGANTESSQSVLKVLQQVAVLVQGNWVVKSDIIYPKDSKSESGVTNDLIQRGRDYVVSLSDSTALSQTQMMHLIKEWIKCHCSRRCELSVALCSPNLHLPG